jgi:hypothetical protein
MGGNGPAVGGKASGDSVADAFGRAGNQGRSFVTIRHGGKMRHGA